MGLCAGRTWRSGRNEDAAADRGRNARRHDADRRDQHFRNRQDNNCGRDKTMTTASGGKDNWRDTILAGLANYIDAGSIVAGSAALALWQESYKLSNDFVG